MTRTTCRAESSTRSRKAGAGRKVGRSEERSVARGPLEPSFERAEPFRRRSRESGNPGQATCGGPWVPAFARTTGMAWSTRKKRLEMIVELGHFALILALMLALLQASLPLVGAARGHLGWVACGEGTGAAPFGLVVRAFSPLVTAASHLD